MRGIGDLPSVRSIVQGHSVQFLGKREGEKDREGWGWASRVKGLKVWDSCLRFSSLGQNLLKCLQAPLSGSGVPTTRFRACSLPPPFFPPSPPPFPPPPEDPALPTAATLRPPKPKCMPVKQPLHVHSTLDPLPTPLSFASPPHPPQAAQKSRPVTSLHIPKRANFFRKSGPCKSSNPKL